MPEKADGMDGGALPTAAPADDVKWTVTWGIELEITRFLTFPFPTFNFFRFLTLLFNLNFRVRFLTFNFLRFNIQSSVSNFNFLKVGNVSGRNISNFFRKLEIGNL